MTRSERRRCVVLISGSGTNLQAFIDAANEGHLAGGIAAVISNRPEAFGLQRAERAGIPTCIIDHRLHADREQYDRVLAEAIDRYQPDLVVLAGFMRILGAAFVAHYAGRMINIHPSLLPAFKGLHTHRRALEAGVAEHGCSVHFVTPELDGGPVIARARLTVAADDTEDSLASRVQDLEHHLYPRCAAMILDGRLRLGDDGVPTLDGQPLVQGALDP